MIQDRLASGVAFLPHLGVIRAKGPDAAHFLHNQLTQDFLLLQEGQARLAGFCSAKGRLQMSFVAWRQAPDEFLLVGSADLIAPTLKRLSMFVLRSKVQLSDASAQYRVYGCVGDTATQQGVPAQAWAVHQSDMGTAVSMYPALGQARCWLITPSEQAAPQAPALELAIWQWTEVHSGVALISPALVDLFVPQMINYESIGGVNFKKGCYPGQEVVARSQFRGVIKRRGFIGHCDSAAQPGDELFQHSDPDQGCGTVLLCAPHPDGGFDLFFSAQSQAVEGGALHLQSHQGPTVSTLALPYPLLADI